MADRASVADMAVRGYRGGRIFCRSGCTSIWLVERLVKNEPVPPKEYARYQHTPRRFLCQCGQWDLTGSNNTKRCRACRNKRQHTKHRDAQRRYVLRRAIA